MATDSISRLIFNTLAQHESINLPGVGSLRVVSEPARVRGNKTLAPPSTQVYFSPEENAEFANMIKLIRDKSKKTEQVSLENYQKWGANVYEDDAIRIPSVGTIKDDRFTPTAELERALNPAGVQPVKLPRQMGSSQLLLWIVAALLVGGGLAVGLITLLNSRPGKYDAPYAEVRSRTEVPAATPPEADIPIDGEETDDATTDLVPVAPETSEATAPAVSETSAATAPATSESAPKSGDLRFYVVVGTYSTDANADRFIASARQRDNAQNYRKLPLPNGKIVVYTAEAASEAEANRLRRTLSVTFPDVWVFKQTVR